MFYSGFAAFTQNHPYQNLEQLSHIAIVSFKRALVYSALFCKSIVSNLILNKINFLRIDKLVVTETGYSFRLNFFK